MRILCGGCGRQIEVDDPLAGGQIQCEFCSRIIHVPALDGAAGDAPPRPDAVEAGDELTDEFVAKARLALRKKLLVVCVSCGERLAVEQRLAGNVARCPSCGGQIVIPSVAADDIPAGSEELMSEPDRSVTLDLAEQAAQGPAPASTAPAPATPVAGSVPARPRPEVPPAPRRRPLPVRRRRMFPIVLLVGMVGVGTGLLGVMLGRSWRPGPGEMIGPADSPPPSTRQEPPDVAVADPTPAPQPRTRPVPVPPPDPVPPPPPPAPRAQVKVTGARASGLGAGGLVPAPLGKAYLTVTVQLQAGAEELSVDHAKGQVTLASDGVTFPAVGRPAEGPVPLAAQAGAFAVPPTASRVESFVFLVPIGLRAGTIRVAGLPEADLGRVERTDAPAPEALAGTYEESGRRLKVAFDDPFLERIRAAGKGKLVVAVNAGLLDVSLPAAGLTGKATFDHDGTYLLLLTDAADKLRCHLRLVDGGAKLVLYLDDKPYHQVIYTRQ